jgi:hypothetical protein
MLQARVHLITLDPAELDDSVKFAETVPGWLGPAHHRRRRWEAVLVAHSPGYYGGRVRCTGGSEFWREAAALGPGR